MLFSGNGPQAKRCSPDHHRFRWLNPAYDECNQVCGHFDRIGEADDFLPAVNRFSRDRSVGDSNECWIDDQSRGVDCLEVRFIPAGKSPTGIGGLELCCRYAVRYPAFVFVGASIKSAELIVERAGKCNGQPPGAW